MVDKYVVVVDKCKIKIICGIGGKTMEPHWILFVLAIIIALNSDKIDAAANASHKLKKWLIVICAFMAMTSIILIIKSLGVIS